jgi:hypothetical protein
MTDKTDNANDLEVLFPDETLNIAGEQVEVREFRYLQGLQALPLARPILVGLGELLQDQTLDPLALEALIAEHQDAWLALIAISTGRPVAWIQGLRDGEGMRLSLAFWRVNAGFFMRRLVFGGALAVALKQRVSPSPSASSSTPSSAPATAATPATSPSD